MLPITGALIFYSLLIGIACLISILAGSMTLFNILVPIAFTISNGLFQRFKDVLLPKSTV